MSDGGGGNTTTETQTSEPWAGAQPYLREALTGAQTAYQSGKGFNYFPDSTVVPFAPQTTQALGNMEGIANQGDSLGQAANSQALGVLNSGGMSDRQKDALGKTYDVATGVNGLGTESDYRGLLARTMNPYYENLVDREATKIGDQVNSTFSDLGRYGSASHTGALVDQVGDFRNRPLSDQYNQGIANERGILGDITGIRSADIANQVGAGGQINAAGNQATANV